MNTLKRFDTLPLMSCLLLLTIGETFQWSVALITFFSIFAAGMVFTLFSLIFGGLGDADHGGDFGGDHGDTGGHDVSTEEGDVSIGLLSVRGISLLLTGFGGVAFIVQYYTAKILLSSIAGLISGWVFAFVCLLVFRMLVRQQATSGITAEDFIGADGYVITTIPANQFGEVMLRVSDGQIAKQARADGDEAIPAGTPVKVTRYFSGIVVVKKLS